MQLSLLISQALKYLFRGPVLVIGLFASLDLAEAQTFSGPISITSGGTYTGNWQSTSVSVPAVTVSTSSPVTIINSTVKGPGPLIDCETYGAKLTVKNTAGYGVITGVPQGQPVGRFVFTYQAASLTVENCYMAHTVGIGINSIGYPNMVIRILYNRALDIDGRESNGAGGYQYGRSIYPNFVGFNTAITPDAEVGWNEEINIPYESQVDDSISTYGSLGTAAKPILVHDNYVQGGYYFDMTVPYTGTGFNLGDTAGGTGYVQLYNNQSVNYGNDGISVTAGHNNVVYGNRVISSGYLPNSTTPLGYSSYGIWVANYYNDAGWANNNIYNNTSGYYSSWFHQMQDYSITGTGATQSNNVSLPGPITTATENLEYVYWQQKLAANDIEIGPVSITQIANSSIYENANTGAIAFTIGGGPTPAASLTVTGSSSNPTLVPTANIVFGGSGANRTVTVSPATSQTGTAAITVSVSDGTETTNASFTLTVNAVNTPPTISAISNQSINSGTNTGALAFTVGDAQVAANLLTVTGSSSNTTLVPTANIVFGGSGANRTVTVTPAASQSGSATITLTVSDGTLTASTAFTLTVLTPLQAWQFANFGANWNNPLIAGDTADPAGDGIPNLMKYALNLNPMADGVAGLPVGSVMKIGGTNYLTLSYTQVLSATAITYTPEVSGNMQTWNSGLGYVGSVSVTPNPGGATETVVVQDLTPVTNGVPRFIRLGVTGP